MTVGSVGQRPCPLSLRTCIWIEASSGYLVKVIRRGLFPSLLRDFLWPWPDLNRRYPPDSCSSMPRLDGPSIPFVRLFYGQLSKLVSMKRINPQGYVCTIICSGTALEPMPLRAG